MRNQEGQGFEGDMGATFKAARACVGSKGQHQAGVRRGKQWETEFDFIVIRSKQLLIIWLFKRGKSSVRQGLVRQQPSRVCEDSPPSTARQGRPTSTAEASSESLLSGSSLKSQFWASHS